MNPRPVLKVACGRQEDPPAEFADRWGWAEIETDWRQVVRRDGVAIVDIAAPPIVHHEIALEAARAGKHVFCERPIALTAEDAREMYEEAEKAGVVHYVNHNYRRCPAVALARQLIDEGKIGRIYHWRGAYLQSWLVDPQFPLTWHLRKELAGSGAQFNMNSHMVDLARYLVGEIKSVTAMAAMFVEEWPLPTADAGTFQAGASRDGTGK